MGGSLGAELLAAVAAIRAMGLFELNSGHVAARLPGRNAYLVPRHLHGAGGLGSIDSLTEADLVEVSLDNGTWPEGQEPPEEVHLHTEIFRARPEVAAIVHCHPEAPVALSIADQPVLPVHHHGSLFGPAVAIFPHHFQINSADRGRELARALDQDWAIVLRAHGAVAVGRGLKESVAVMFTLDQCAKRQLLAAAAGTPRGIELPPGQRPELSANSIRNIWFTFAPAGT